MLRRTKIVATVGPATDDVDTMDQLIRSGMDVARVNFSHGDFETHRKRVKLIRERARLQERHVAIMVDLQGPKIRTGTFAGGPVTLAGGDTFTITTRDVPGGPTEVGTTYAGLPGDVEIGDDLLIDDGKVMLRATAVSETDVECEVVVGGVHRHRFDAATGSGRGDPNRDLAPVGDQYSLHAGVSGDSGRLRTPPRRRSARAT